jgi:hypothetical protein
MLIGQEMREGMICAARLPGPGFYAELAAFRSVMTVPPRCRLTAWAPGVVAMESWSIVLAARKPECGWFLR